MNKEDITIPIILLGAIILSSIIPIVQIILITLNGGLTSIIAIPFDTGKPDTIEVTSIIFNSILTPLGLFLFYRSKVTVTRVWTSLLVLFAGQAVMLFITDKILKEVESYFVYWTVISGTPVVLTLLVGLLKSQKSRLKFGTKI